MDKLEKLNNLAKYEKFLLKIIEQAGDAIIKDYQKLDYSQVRLKTPRDLVTAADLRSEKIIMAAIKKNFPDHQILSEESGRTTAASDYLWIIDPLDGTTNFFMHNPLWSVSIALAHKGKLILGAIYAPLQKELFRAQAGGGAYLNNKKISVDNSPIKTLSAFCNGRETKNIKRTIKYFSYQKLHALDCRQLGSAAIEMAYVAAGRLSSLMIPGVWAWDVAAGALLVREAGGKVTDFQGRDWKINEKDIIAAAPKPHKQVLKTIKDIKL